MSVVEGDRNKAKVLSILMENPLTFSELKKAAKLSSPVLAKHLKALSEEGLVQKNLSRDDRVVYQVLSRKEAVSLIALLFSGFFLYIVGRKLSAETMTSIIRDLEKTISPEEAEKLAEELENWEPHKPLELEENGKGGLRVKGEY